MLNGSCWHNCEIIEYIKIFKSSIKPQHNALYYSLIVLHEGVHRDDNGMGPQNSTLKLSQRLVRVGHLQSLSLKDPISIPRRPDWTKCTVTYLLA